MTERGIVGKGSGGGQDGSGFVRSGYTIRRKGIREVTTVMHSALFDIAAEADGTVVLERLE